MDRISLYWRNATADAIGDKHGVTEKELQEIAPKIKQLYQDQLNDRKAGSCVTAICRMIRT